MQYQNLKVAGTSRPHEVAGAIAGTIREHGFVVVEAIGAGAINQAVKAIAIARGYLSPQGIDPWCRPSFFVAILEGGVERTGIQMRVEDPHRAAVGQG